MLYDFAARKTLKIFMPHQCQYMVIKKNMLMKIVGSQNHLWVGKLDEKYLSIYSNSNLKCTSQGYLMYMERIKIFQT